MAYPSGISTRRSLVTDVMSMIGKCIYLFTIMYTVVDTQV